MWQVTRSLYLAFWAFINMITLLHIYSVQNKIQCLKYGVGVKSTFAELKDYNGLFDYDYALDTYYLY